MRLPVQLRVSPRPSRVATVAITALAVVTFGVVLTLATPAACDFFAAVVLAGWAHHHIRLHGTRTARHAVVEILLSSDAVIVARRRDGKLIAGHVRSATFVHPAFTSIVWRPDGARWSRTIPLVADMLDVDDFRRLRVLLRYGRREVTAGAPASQA
jgi:hypothetical protein